MDYVVDLNRHRFLMYAFKSARIALLILIQYKGYNSVNQIATGRVAVY